MKVHRILLIAMGFVVATPIFMYCYSKRGMDGTGAQVSLNSYHEPGTVAVTILDSKGSPVSGVAVATESGSGTSNPPSVTDSRGFATIQPGESEVIGLYVEGEQVWHSPYYDNFLEYIFYPSCSRGVAFTVKLKTEATDPYLRLK